MMSGRRPPVTVANSPIAELLKMWDNGSGHYGASAPAFLCLRLGFFFSTPQIDRKGTSLGGLDVTPTTLTPRGAGKSTLEVNE
jgi:hypothetical protein